MENTKSDYKVHVFVCTNKKDKKECCADKDGEKLRADLKDWAKENPDWKKRLRVNASGCLDRCNEGIAVAIYPQNRWFIHVERDDIDDLKTVITDLMNDRKSGN